MIPHLEVIKKHRSILAERNCRHDFGPNHICILLWSEWENENNGIICFEL